MKAARSRPLIDWLDARTGWSAWTSGLAGRHVEGLGIEPALAAAGLFLMAVLVGSGVLLMMHYRPSPAEAQASIVAISSAAAFGSLVRGVHQWASDSLVIVACAWILTLLVRRTYRRPGELVWVAAVLAVVLVLLLAFTGSVLPFDERSTAHARVGGSMAQGVPWIGAGLRRFLLGGDQAVNGASLARAFGLHVAVLPASLTLLLAAQYALWRRASEALAGGASQVPVYPDFFVRVAALCAGLLLALVSLSMFAPRLAEAPEGAKIGPPWYLASIHSLLVAAPDHALGVTGPQLVLALVVAGYFALLALPFFDPRGTRLARALACGGALVLVVLTVYGNL